jgi:hypothetical protein
MLAILFRPFGFIAPKTLIGKVDYFKRNIIDIGKPYKIRVWHDKSGAFSGWHLNKVRL